MEPTETQLARLTLAEREMFDCKKQKKQEDIRFYSVFAIVSFILIFIGVYIYFWNPSGFAKIFIIAFAGLIAISGTLIMCTIKVKTDELDNRMLEIANREIHDKKRAFCLTKRQATQWGMVYPRSHDRID